MSVCMSIEGSTARLLTFSGKKINSWFDVELESRWTVGGIIAAPDELGKAIGDAMEGNKTPRKGVICALPSSGTSAQVLSIPASVKKGKIQETALRELKRTTTAAAIEGDYIYCYPLIKKRDKQEVFILTVPRSNIINLVEACRAAGIQLKNIELMPFALARAIGCKDGVIVHAEKDSIEIVIVVDHFPAVFRSVTVRGADGAEQAAQEILTELPRAIDYYNRTNLDNPLGEHAAVYLSGELAVDPELVMGVAEVTGREVASVELSVNCPPEFPQAKYMTHVGLMLKSKK